MATIALFTLLVIAAPVLCVAFFCLVIDAVEGMHQ
jgi:hypothetical protein